MRALRAFALFAMVGASISSPAVANGTPDKSPDAGGRSSRMVKFPGGQVAIDADRGAEHLIVTDAAGKVLSESWCDSESGSYDELARLFRRFREAVLTKDAAAVAKLVRVGSNGFDDSLALHGLGESVRRPRWKAKYGATARYLRPLLTHPASSMAIRITTGC